MDFVVPTSKTPSSHPEIKKKVVLSQEEKDRYAFIKSHKVSVKYNTSEDQFVVKVEKK